MKQIAQSAMRTVDKLYQDLSDPRYIRLQAFYEGTPHEHEEGWKFGGSALAKSELDAV